MQMRTRLFAFSVILVLILCTPLASPAQTETATLSGRVTDPQGAVVPGAAVEITNIDTNIKVVSTTNDSGIYVVPNLRPGRYRLSVRKEGFKEIVKTDIVLHVQDTIALNFGLEVGSVTQSVTVTGGAPLVNTESAAVSTVIDRQFVESLPLNGRSFNTLLQLTPGVVITPVGSGLGQFSIAGQRTDANNFTVDGVSANFGVVAGTSAPRESGSGSAQAFSALGGTSSLVSVEALQEFRVETSSYAPEFGRTPGGQVILTTRSGTNDLHGGLYEYFRNDKLDANDWFANAAGKPRAPERHNDFGGYLGGPIRKDKTFFFLSYEGARLRLPQASTIQVPSEWARTVAAPPALAPFLNAYPQPDDRTITPNVYTSPFTGVWSDSATLNAGSVRIDHTFNSRFSIFGRYNDAPSEVANRFPNSFGLSTVVPSTVNTRTATVGLNAFLSPRMSNTFRANYSTQYTASTSFLDSFGGAVPPPLNLLFGSLSSQNNLASFFIVDSSNFLVGPTSTNTTRQFNFSDDFSFSVGTHQMKYGADYRIIDLHTDPSQHSLTFLATSVQDFISSNGQVFLFPGTLSSARVRSQSFSLYAQDTWRLSRRLTFTYGIRWELSPAPEALGKTTLASWSNVDNPSLLALAPSGTLLWQTTYGNFAPRAGVAYSLTDKGDFVLRAGGGVFYDLGVGQSVVGQFPNLALGVPAIVQLPLADPTPFLPILSLQPPYPDAAQGFSPNLKLPRSYQWSVALEKSFGGKQAISATYVGQAGRDLLRQEALFQPNPSFSGDFLLTRNDARSNYHALQLQYRRPLSARVQALVNYTWSHSLDNASDDVVAGLSNTVISAASDYASSSFDVRHIFSGALTYDIPSIVRSGVLALLTKDWSVDTVIVARSGFPFNAFNFLISPDPNFNARVRPDRVPDQPLYLYGSQCVAQQVALGLQGPLCPGGRALNLAAFSTPSTARQGTEGRNDIPGFGLTQVDLSLGRKLPISERVKLQFRVDAFNVFNHPNFTNPQGFFQFGPSFLQSQKMLNQDLGGLSPIFQQGGPRSLQLSLKFSF